MYEVMFLFYIKESTQKNEKEKEEKIQSKKLFVRLLLLAFAAITFTI